MGSIGSVLDSPRDTTIARALTERLIREPASTGAAMGEALAKTTAAWLGRALPYEPQSTPLNAGIRKYLASADDGSDEDRYAKWLQDSDPRVVIAAALNSNRPRPVAESLGESAATPPIGKIAVWLNRFEMGYAEPFPSELFAHLLQARELNAFFFAETVTAKILSSGYFSRGLIEFLVTYRSRFPSPSFDTIPVLSEHPLAILAEIEKQASESAGLGPVDSSERWAGWVQQCVKQDPKGREVMTRWINSDSPLLRRFGVQAIPDELLPTSASKLLREKESPLVLEAVLNRFRSAGIKPRTPRVRKLVSHPAPAVRLAALNLILHSGNASDLAWLRKSNFDPSQERVRFGAVLMAGGHKEWKLELLEKALKSKDIRDRYLAQSYLSTMGEPEWLPLYFESVARETSPILKVRALSKVGKTEKYPFEAVTRAIQGLDAKYDDARPLLSAAALSMSDSKSDGWIEAALVSSKDPSPEVRKRVADVLDRAAKNPNVNPENFSLFSDPDANVRAVAFKAVAGDGQYDAGKWTDDLIQLLASGRNTQAAVATLNRTFRVAKGCPQCPGKILELAGHHANP
ncbi:MAG: hypothetical protein AAB425_13300, partial [Bdellovibrionota bacterium]